MLLSLIVYSARASDLEGIDSGTSPTRQKSDRLFPMNMKSLQANFYHQRKRKAREFDNPRLIKLTFTSIRHRKATIEYHHGNDEFISRVATSLKGAGALIEAGFEYITDMDGYEIFRKRKYVPRPKNMGKTF